MAALRRVCSARSSLRSCALISCACSQAAIHTDETLWLVPLMMFLMIQDPQFHQH